MTDNNLSFSRITLWASGVDKHLVKICHDGEIKKFESIGVMVFIPAILAFFSMSFLLTSYLYRLIILIPVISLAWSIIIFFIDRSIVISIDKSSHGFIHVGLRLLMSLIISVVISHPLTTAAFKDEIDTKIKDIANIEFYGNDEIKKLEELINNKNNQIKKIDERLLNYESLINAEITGNKVFTTIDGTSHTSTGQTGCSSDSQSCSLYKRAYNSTIQEKGTILQEIASLNEKLSKLKEEKNKAINGRNDLSSQTKALYYIVSENSLLGFGVLACFAFFLTVDMLAVLTKLFISTKKYDQLQSSIISDEDYNSAINDYKKFSQNQFYQSMMNSQNGDSRQKDNDTLKENHNDKNKTNPSLVDNSKNINKIVNTLTAGGDLVFSNTNNFGIKEAKENASKGTLYGMIGYIALSLTSLLDGLTKVFDNIFKLKDHFNELLTFICKFSGYC